MPDAMAEHVRHLSYNDKFKYIISGMKCEKYVPEWKSSYFKIANFVHMIFKERASQYDAMQV